VTHGVPADSTPGSRSAAKGARRSRARQSPGAIPNNRLRRSLAMGTGPARPPASPITTGRMPLLRISVHIAPSAMRQPDLPRPASDQIANDAIYSHCPQQQRDQRKQKRGEDHLEAALRHSEITIIPTSSTSLMWGPLQLLSETVMVMKCFRAGGRLVKVGRGCARSCPGYSRYLPRFCRAQPYFRRRFTFS
jgi:hypothetical protein